MKYMYTPFQIGTVELKNRLVASAMFEYGAADGVITAPIVERYRQLAQGGSGLIITGMHAVSKSGATAPLMVNAEYDGYEADLKNIVDIVHENGSRLFVQIQHCGYKTWNTEGYDRFGPSDTEVNNLPFHAASVEELKKVTADFGAAAAKCKAAGADGVQIHGAHGYLINEFLSPSTNHRTDEYGGPIENRARFLFEIYDAIRASVGSDYPVAVKFPFSDLIAQSITPEESLYVCRELEKKGIDMIEVSSGMVMDNSAQAFTPVIKAGKNEAPFLDFARQVAEQVSIPVISVCGYKTPEVIEQALKNAPIAAVSIGRPLVREPGLPNRWQSGDTAPAKCVSCNGCCLSFPDGIITCQVEKKLRKQA